MGDIFFLFALIIAISSVVLSRLSERYWDPPKRMQARLDYGPNPQSIVSDDRKTVYLTDNCYKVDFGAPVKLLERPLDGVTTVVGIDGLQSDGILKTSKYIFETFKSKGLKAAIKEAFNKLKQSSAFAMVFLNDNSFLINGNVSIYPKQNDLDHDKNRLIYDQSEIKNGNILENYDLIYIKDANNTPIAVCVFCLIPDHFANPLGDIRSIIILNQEEVEQNAE